MVNGRRRQFLRERAVHRHRLYIRYNQFPLQTMLISQYRGRPGLLSWKTNELRIRGSVVPHRDALVSYD